MQASGFRIRRHVSESGILQWPGWEIFGFGGQFGESGVGGKAPHKWWGDKEVRKEIIRG